MAINSIRGTLENEFLIGYGKAKTNLKSTDTELIIDKPIKINEENVITDVNTQELENKTIDATKNTITNLTNDEVTTKNNIWSAEQTQNTITTQVAEAIGGITMNPSTTKFIKLKVGTTNILDTNVLPVDAIILKTMVNINKAYIGTDVAINIKLNGTVPLTIMSSQTIDESVEELYIREQFSTVTSDNTGAIQVVVSGSNITQGGADVVVLYIDSTVSAVLTGYGN